MASRALWSGQLRLSLVSISVELHSAKKSGAHISFRQIHKPSGKRVHYQKIVNGIGPIDAEDIVKGFEYDKDRYVLLEPDEIDEVKLDSRKTLELVQFVDACEIPPLFYDKPYYLIPADKLAEDAYRVIRDALRRSAKIGLGQLAMRGREYLCAVRPCGDGLLLETLHYADEIKSAEPLFANISDDKSDSELLDVASALMDKKTAPFNAEAYKDHYRMALRELVDEKTQNKQHKVTAKDDSAPATKGSNVVDLMAALKQSLEKSGKAKSGDSKSSAAKRPKAKKTASGKTATSKQTKSRSTNNETKRSKSKTQAAK